MNYTLRFEKSGAATLDGSSQVTIGEDGVTLDNSLSGEFRVQIPNAVAFGAVDPGAFLDAAGIASGLGSGRTFVVSTFGITSAGGVYTGPGTNIVERVTPTAGTQSNRETIQDLFVNAGNPAINRKIFMPQHLVTFTTTVIGPHVISLLMTPLEDADAEGAFIEQ